MVKTSALVLPSATSETEKGIYSYIRFIYILLLTIAVFNTNAGASLNIMQDLVEDEKKEEEVIHKGNQTMYSLYYF